MDHLVYAAATPILLALVYWLFASFRPSHLPYPPGPKRHPLLGNLRQFPKARFHETFSGEWRELYGDFIYARILGRHIVVVNSLEDAKELFDRRGHNFAGRRSVAIERLVIGRDWNVANASPGPFHTEIRAMYKKAIGQREVSEYDNLIEEESRDLVDSLAGFEGDPWSKIHEATGSVTIRITYGDSVYRAIGKELDELNAQSSALTTMIAVPEDLMTEIVHYLPDWLPFEFKRIGARGKDLQLKMRYWAWGETVKHFEAGVAEQSIALKYLEKGKNLDTVRDGLALVYVAGVDNTSSSIHVFLSEMLLHPDVQEKVHAELDRELPPGVQPTFGDRQNLPYLDAVWRESKRMHPSTPICVPHVSLEDTEYKGWFIPKGTSFQITLGFMCRDPRIWERPDEFVPERWLSSHNPKASSLPNVDDIMFGFGRRICPGRFLADRTAFVFVAALMKAYEVVPMDGDTVPKEYVYLDTFVRRPVGFRCKLKSRSRA